MTLTAVYERFLASPNPLSLSENASLHYIPTLISYTQSGPIIRHLESQNKNVVKIKSQKTISAVEGTSSIALEVDTTLEFLTDGGAYLPKMESYVVVDRVATLPITHIVQFSQDQKISQIRMSWDQGSLLKQTEVIGSRGRNWPVFHGKDQVKLIASSVSNTTVPTNPTAPISPTSPRGRSNNENGHGGRDASPAKKVIKDPYTSLDTFWTQDGGKGTSQSEANPAIAPRAESFKPPPRNMSEIFAAGHEDNEPGSPKKSQVAPVIAPKGRSHQKYGPARIFDDDEGEAVVEPKIYKTNPARYNHFDIGDVPENDPFQHNAGGRTQQAKAVPLTARTGKHESQWDVSDFATPAKVAAKERPEDKVHFEIKDDGTPVERKNVPKARKDAETHFNFGDQATPAPARIIARTDAAKGLYRNVLEENEEPLSDISNRRNEVNTGVTHNRQKSEHNMGAHWSMEDQSPEQTKRPAKAFKQQSSEPQWGMNATTEQEDHQRGKSRGGQKGFWDF